MASSSQRGAQRRAPQRIVTDWEEDLHYDQKCILYVEGGLTSIPALLPDDEFTKWYHAKFRGGAFRSSSSGVHQAHFLVTEESGDEKIWRDLSAVNYTVLI